MKRAVVFCSIVLLSYPRYAVRAEPPPCGNVDLVQNVDFFAGSASLRSPLKLKPDRLAPFVDAEFDRSGTWTATLAFAGRFSALRYPDCHDLHLIIDGEVFSPAQVRYFPTTLPYPRISPPRGIVEAIVVAADTSLFDKIAQATKIEYKVCAIESSVDAETICAIHEWAKEVRAEAPRNAKLLTAAPTGRFVQEAVYATLPIPSPESSVKHRAILPRQPSSTIDQFAMSPLRFSAIMAALLVLAIIPIMSLLRDLKSRKESQRRLHVAANRAFGVQDDEADDKTIRLRQSQDDLEKRATDLAGVIEANRQVLQAGSLLDFYSKQIEAYQTETRSRARASFVFAIVAMVSGLTFVFWGGYKIIGNEIIGGASIAAIGGALGAFITKTFLDVHRLSIEQLNRYFRQPVVNANIISAQRLADQLGNENLRQDAYIDIIARVILLIRETDSVGDLDTVKSSKSSSLREAKNKTPEDS